MSGLSVRDLSVAFGRRRVLSGLTLPPLAQGELTVLAGPNAAGKSTLLRAIARLHPSQGRVTLDGRDLAQLPGPERARTIGFMPQTLPGATGLSALESVLAALQAGGGFGGRHAEDRAMSALARLGVADLALEPLSRLSGGQRQSVSLAQAIVRDPRLLLLDEPTSALDLARQHRLLAEAQRLAREGRVVVAVLHDLALAAQWADRMVVLHRGALHAFGAPAEVLTPPMLAEVYGVRARVERCSAGRLQVLVDGVEGAAA